MKALLLRCQTLLLAMAIALPSLPVLGQRAKYNFNADWHYVVSDAPAEAFFATPLTAKKGVHAVTLPHAANEDEAFARGIASLTDSVVWYVKTFSLPFSLAGRHVFVEFEGVRQGADVFLNGHHLGLHENGVMAFGYELTPYLKEGVNEMALRIDPSWHYRERATGTSFQWNNRNFNANYGGIPKNVVLHVTGDVFQTLPLYSTLGTTGVYVYGTDYDVARRKATVHAESQVVNASGRPCRLHLQVEVRDVEGHRVACWTGRPVTVAAGDTVTLSAAKRLGGLHFWSWGYGYLYSVATRVVGGGNVVDEVVTRTGFRQTSFADGLIRLNGRVLMVHGYAQRTSNEWPSVGMSVPPWMSDYSNSLMVESGANVVRWMHVTPWKQDVESCDRVGLIQAMPAGDAEKDCTGRQWEQRKELMRDAIIYNRNNPSILFYESGNESISAVHMAEMAAIRDTYDPHGGRAIGSREMLDIDEAEYGGEMLYINKSAGKPVWAMEYCRDEAYRMYWDEQSYPWHHSGNGPLVKGQPATDYNRNQDDFAVELIRRWYDYWCVRAGMGRRVSSGGVKIIFSDTNTHGRSEYNYRVSGVVDAMRIPKDAFYAHQVMWGSWVDIEHSATRILGHWNYEPGIRRAVRVVSTSPVVQLYLDDRLLDVADRREYDFLHTFDDVAWERGTLRAVGLAADGVTVESEHTLATVGPAAALRLTRIDDGRPMLADGADLALVEVEVTDAAGRRLPLDNRLVRWTLGGAGEWRGGIARSPNGDNHILDTELPVEAGVGRVLVRSLTRAGEIVLTATCKGLPPQTIRWTTQPVAVQGGLATHFAADAQPCLLTRGETPLTPSYADKLRTVSVVQAQAAANAADAAKSFDDNELSEWRNDGRLVTASITYTLAEAAPIDIVSLKLTGWRMRSYPLEVLAGDSVVWRGRTPKSLGYVHLTIPHPVSARTYTIRQIGQATEGEGFGQIIEVAAPTAGELDLFKTPGSDDARGELRIVEVDFLKKIEG